MFRPLTVLVVCAALCPAADPPAKDTLGDPLPKGAIVRLGTERMRNLHDDDPAFFTPDGKKILAAVNLRWVFLDPITGRTLERVECDGLWWGLHAMSADGKRAVSHNRKDYVVWEVATGKELFTLPNAGQATPPHFSLSANGKSMAHEVVSDSEKPKTGLKLPVYDVDTKKLVVVLEIAQNSSGHVHLSADGSRAVTWGEHREGKDDPFPQDPDSVGRKVQVWDVKRGKELFSVIGSGFGKVQSATLSPTGDQVAVVPSDGTVMLFDADTGKELKSLIPRQEVSAVAYSADGKTLAGLGAKGVQLWDASGRSLGACRVPTELRAQGVASIAFREGGTALALTRMEGAAVIWEAPSGKVLSPDVPFLRVTDVAFTARDREVLTADSSHVVKQWDRSGKRTGSVTLPRIATVIDTGYRSDERAFARGLVATTPPLLVRDTYEGVLGFELPSGEPRLRIPSGGDTFFSVTSDGRTAVVTSFAEFWDGKKPDVKLTLIDLTTETRTRTIKLPAQRVAALAVTPDGKRAAVVQREKDEEGEGNGKFILRGYDLTTGKLTAEVEWDAGEEQQAVFLTATPDGSSVLIGLPGKNVLWEYDLATEKKNDRVIESDTRFTTHPVFSADGKWVAVAVEASDAGRVKVLSWPDGKTLHTFTGHSMPVTCLAFSKDGKTLASGSLDSTVLLWDLSKE